MMLIGNNLGERHHDLNAKVAEAAATQRNFEELKLQPEQCDVDKLFKIDLASKYKQVEYILDVLKGGDVFYISRALKCIWLYNDEYSQFINTAYLKNNIFSCMSEKMKRKTLTHISTHMTNPERAIEFYKYCKEIKQDDYAVKFLVNTPDDFKRHLLKDGDNFNDFDDSKFLKQFVGRSFDLALGYLSLCDYPQVTTYKLRYLYSVSDVQYLDILEKHISTSNRCPYGSQRLGIRISRDILKRHKQRIVKRPALYVNILNKNMLVKFLTHEDVKSFTLALLPNRSEYFWSMDFYCTYKFLLEKIPPSELFAHLKQIYILNYQDDTFEMRIEFYNLKYYEMFNIDEREAWALRHIELDEELPGIQNYIWYKFVSYQKASSGIKRYIFLTPDKNERSRIINIFPETARNMEDIIKILSYYFERHVNESEEHKESFINKIIEHHDIYSFSDECWTSLDKLLYSLDVYSSASFVREEYKFRSIIYRILHGKELPEALKEYLDYIRNFYNVISLIEELNEERKDDVAKYLINYYTEKIKPLMDHPEYNKVKDEDDYWQSDSIMDQIHGFVWKIWNTIEIFKRSTDYGPDLVLQFMESNKTFYSYHEIYKPKFVPNTEEDFVRWLKHDTQTAIDGINEIRCNAYRWKFRLSRLFRKLKVYFPNDVGKEYLNYFLDYLTDIPETRREYRNIKMAVVGVFYLADSSFIISFLEKNVPVVPKIDRMTIDNRVLQVQKAICRLAYHSRPPLPILTFQKYIVGDYVHFCVPVFYNYFANLQSNNKFIETLLDAPLSIQKHGLRFAFKAYNTEKLIPIILSAWKKTKNVSLRMILYETLFDRILDENEEVQRRLYEVLKLYTSELNHDDHDNVYALLVSDDLPDVFKGDFIEIAWLTVSKLSNKSIDTKRRISVVSHMEKYMHLSNRDFLRLQIIDDHINDMLCKKKVLESPEYHVKSLIEAKWNLTAKYIVSFTSEVEQKKSLELMQTIMSQCIQSWDLVKRDTYIIRKCLRKFIKTIKDKDPRTIESCIRTVLVYQCILDNFRTSMKKEETYLLNWELQLSITCRYIIYYGMNKNKSKRKVAELYGKKIVRMIKSFVKNREFYRCFFQSLAGIINDVGCIICDILDTNSTGFVYYVCDTLTDCKMTVTHVLALFMLPLDPPYNWEDEHRESILKLKHLNCKEVRSFLYEKYALNDSRVRSYI